MYVSGSDPHLRFTVQNRLLPQANANLPRRLRALAATGVGRIIHGSLIGIVGKNIWLVVWNSCVVQSLPGVQLPRQNTN